MKVNPIRKAVEVALVSLEAPARSLIGVASTSAPDRAGDVVEAGGWVLEPYLANPVVLWAHDDTRPPVARATRVWVEGDRLLFEAQFPPEGEHPFADLVYRLYQTGYLSAFSACFGPLVYEPSPGGGRRYTRQELYEISCVTVPANAQALTEIVKALGDQHTDNTTQTGEETMNLLAKLRERMGLSAEAPEAEVMASAEKALAVQEAVVKALSLDQAADAVAVVKALSAQRGQAAALPGELLSELGLAADAGPSQVLGVVKALKQGAGQARDLAAEVAELKAWRAKDAAEKAVAKALADGKIAPVQKVWAEEYAAKDLAGFQAFVAAAVPMVPVKALPSGAAKSAGAGGLDDAQRAVNKALGISDESFRKFCGEEVDHAA